MIYLKDSLYLELNRSQREFDFFFFCIYNRDYKDVKRMYKDLKVIFMGTPEFSVPVLKMLDEETTVVLVVTQPDKPVGRKKVLTPSPVKEYAQFHHLPVVQPQKIKEESEQILNTECDIIITCAYGQILPGSILDYPELGCVNVHASLLPKYRGGAPIHWCLINGEEKTGVTIMYMDPKMDAGDIITQREYRIQKDDTVETLHKKLSVLGAKTLQNTLGSLIAKTNPRIIQDESQVTYGFNVTREDEKLDFSKTGEQLLNQMRGLNSWPLAYFLFNQQEFKAIEGYFEKKSVTSCGKIVELRKDAFGISCADGVLYLTKIKPFGKQIMSVKDYLNGVDKKNFLESVIS